VVHGVNPVIVRILFFNGTGANLNDCTSCSRVEGSRPCSLLLGRCAYALVIGTSSNEFRAPIISRNATMTGNNLMRYLSSSKRPDLNERSTETKSWTDDGNIAASTTTDPTA